MNNSTPRKLNNKEINKKLREVLPGALHYNFNYPWENDPIHFVDGQGHFLIDADGNKYCDFFSKFGAQILGHKNILYTNDLANILQNKLTAIDHIGLDEISIIEKIIAAVPGGEQVRFSLSGTEAVQNALRLARAFTGKNKIVRFIGHYHGNADSILGGIATEEVQFIPREMPGDQRGTQGRAAHSFLDSILIPWNDIGTLNKVLDLYGNEIAAIIMEPICINGGGISASLEYFEYLEKIAKSANILIIFDEVITGFRLSYGSAQLLTSIKPDIWVFGKAIGGGSLPISCIVSSKEIMGLYADKKVTHGGTFNGYPLGLYAIGCTLNILEDHKADYYNKAINAAKKLQEIIINGANRHGINLVIQGHPMAMCMHISSKPLSNINDWSVQMKNQEEVIRKAFLREHIFIAPPCRLYPNMSIDDSVLEFVESKMDKIWSSINF